MMQLLQYKTRLPTLLELMAGESDGRLAGWLIELVARVDTVVLLKP